MPKILLSSNMIWTISQFRQGLIRFLSAQGFEVVCAADYDEFSAISEQKIIEAGGRFMRVKVSRKGLNPFQDLRYLWGLYRLIKREKPALAINFTIKPIIYGSLAAKMAGVPSFGVTTGLGFAFISDNLLTRITRMLYRFSLRFSHKVFFLNTDDEEIFLNYRLVSKEKSVVLPSEGVDTMHYKPIARNASHKEFSFLFIARLLWEKGIGEYVESARMVKENLGDNVIFRVVGYIDTDNPGAVSRQELEEWIEEGVIKYEGTTDDIRPLIAASDCVVLPSYYREGVPRTLLEAASMERPIIASDNVGCREVIDDGINGYMCKPKDSKDLYDKMVRIIKLTIEERLTMGKAGREKVLRQFDEQIVMQIYLREISQVIG